MNDARINRIGATGKGPVTETSGMTGAEVTPPPPPTRQPWYRRTSYGTAWTGVYGDRVSWGAIWGGTLTAFAVFLLLSVLATAIGITTIQQTQFDPEQVNRAAAVISSIIGLLSFFIGGFVAGRGGGIRGNDAGAINGFLVWALALLIILGLSTFGLGQVFGALGGALAMQRQLAGVDFDVEQIRAGIQAAAWISFLALALSALAATFGGWIGATAEDDDLDEAVG